MNETISELKCFPFDGCEFCMNSIFICEKTGEYLMIVDTHEWDAYNDRPCEFEMAINYCPKCGLKLG